MKLLSIAKHLFAPAGFSSAKPPPGSPKPLPAPVGNRQDVKLWSSQVPEARALLKTLNQMLPPNRPLTTAAGGLHRHPGSLLKAPPGLGSETGAPLNAHQVGHRSIAMDRADSPASATFAALCLQKDVRAVIDVSGIDAPGRSCMKSNVPWFKGDTRVEFRCPLHDSFAVEKRVTIDGQAALHREVGIYMTVNKEPVVALTERDRAEWNTGAQAGKRMDWLRLPMDSQRAVSPAMLLSLSAQADALSDGGGTCVFQSADGGRLSGLFAVAHDLYQELKKPRGRGFNLMDKVTEACVRGRANFSHDLLTAPEDVASLIAMARLMEQQGKRA